MLFVLSFCHKDADLALKNAQWIVTLKNQRQHKVLLACNKQAEEEGWLKRVSDTFSKSGWKTHEFVPMVEDEREWTPEQRQWPRPQNYLWTQTARWIQRVFNEPWFWLEADAVPLCDRWLDLLEIEYHANKQPFMGMYVATLDHEGNPIPAHMSGVAIYPANIALWSSRMLLSEGTAFDMVGAEVTVENMHRTKLIHHCYQAPPFMSVEDLKRINPEAVIFHQNKDGSLIDRLREKRLGYSVEVIHPGGLNIHLVDPVAQRIEQRVSTALVESSTLSGVTDIFIKTYPKDYEHLSYCLRSIAKFAKGFRAVVIISPTEPPCISGIDIPIVRWRKVEDKDPGYLWQQSVKMHADQYTDAEYILYMDSDCVFTHEVSPECFFRDGKPVWLYTMFDQARDDQHVWKPVMKKFVGLEPDREMMRRHPFVVPRRFLEDVRKFCRRGHSVPLEDYIMSQHRPGQVLTFSEFNCMGWFAWNCKRDAFTFMDALDPNAPPVCIYQGYTHGDEARKQQDFSKYQEILKGGDAPCQSRVSDQTLIGSNRESTFNPEDSLGPTARIRTLVGSICDVIKENKTARLPVLHAELRKAGLIAPAKKRSARK